MQHITLRLVAIALVPFPLLAACSSAATEDAERSDEGVIENESDIGVFRLRIGDCFDHAGVGVTVEALTAIPCEEPHTAEVLDAYDYVSEGDVFPGLDVLGESAVDECIARFNTITGVDFMIDTEWNLAPIYPTAESWDRLDDREVLCIVVPRNGEPVSAPINRV